MALPLIGLPTLISAALAWLVRWYLTTKLAKFAVVLALFTFFMGLMLTFIAAAIAAVYTVQQAAPDQFAFAFGFLPPSAPAIFAIYLSILTMKRVLDWKYEFVQQIADKAAWKPNLNY